MSTSKPKIHPHAHCMMKMALHFAHKFAHDQTPKKKKLYSKSTARETPKCAYRPISGFRLQRWPHGAKHQHHPPSLSIIRFPTRPPGCDALRCHHARHVELDTRRGRSRSSWRRDQRINSAEAPFLLRRRTRWLEADRDGRVGFSAAPFAVERRCDGEVGIVAPLGPRPHRYTQHARRPIQTALVATVAAASAVVDGWGIASAASPPFSAPLSAMCLMGGLPATAM